jgi:hypothetical protein
LLVHPPATSAAPRTAVPKSHRAELFHPRPCHLRIAVNLLDPLFAWTKGDLPAKMGDWPVGQSDERRDPDCLVRACQQRPWNSRNTRLCRRFGEARTVGATLTSACLPV